MHLAKSQRSGPRPIIVKVDSPAGKIPANDLPSERAILSSAMLSGPCLDIALELLREEHFYDEANGKIFRAMSALAEAGKAVDINSVRAWLSDAEWLQRIGGTKYLLQISDETPSVHEKHMRGYCEVVIDKWRIRRLADTTGAINAQCYGDYGGDASAFIDASEQALYELAREQRRSTNAEPLGPILAAAVKTINDAAERGARITGIPTGYEKLDAKTAGLHDGELTIVAARPGMGKTSLVLNIGVNVASPRCAPGAETYPEDHPKKWARGHGVAIFSLEMPREQLAARMLCSEARVDLDRRHAGHRLA
jgi:replicative DNA helicase